MLLFSLDPECRLAPVLAAALDETLARHEDRRFEDGEHKLRPLVDPRGDDVYVLCSLHGGPHESPHDKLCRLLLFIATLREHGAARVTAVVPYLAYARKDRQTKPFDPVTLRYVAQLFEAVGTDQVIVLEAHNVAAFQNAFRCTTLHLDAHRAFDATVARTGRRRPAGGGFARPGRRQAGAAVARVTRGAPGAAGALRDGRQAAQSRPGHELHARGRRCGRHDRAAARRPHRQRRDDAAVPPRRCATPARARSSRWRRTACSSALRPRRWPTRASAPSW